VPTDDPDDSIEPDDSGPRLSVTLKQLPNGETYALPEPLEAEQTSGRCPYTLEQSSAPQSPPRAPAAAASTPAMPDLLDPVALRTMPPRVAAFMLYEPREPPRGATARLEPSVSGESSARAMERGLVSVVPYTKGTQA
jgi:hypothetical protein